MIEGRSVMHTLDGGVEGGRTSDGRPAAVAVSSEHIWRLDWFERYQYWVHSCSSSSWVSSIVQNRIARPMFKAHAALPRHSPLSLQEVCHVVPVA